MPILEIKAPGAKEPIFAPWSFDPFSPEGGGEPFRVRDLITKLAHESVRDFHLREADRDRPLTPEKLAEALARGKVGSARNERQTVDPDEAAGQALQAFEDGLFLLFVDEEEKQSLEDEVHLNPETRVTVVRLVALAGR